MVDFRPFRGIRYQSNGVGALDHLICPPYDIISPAHERQLHERSPYNMVRLELSEASDLTDPDRYTRAQGHYRQWLAEGVLQRDTEPAYYLLRQRYAYEGQTLERYSITGLVHLEPLGTGVIPHEETRAMAKEDRLALMEACAANFSPIMALFQDEGHLVETARNRAMAAPPEAQFVSDDGQEYTLWRMADERATATVQEVLATRPVYIADGHHRYETALTYLERHRQDPAGAAPAAEFVMASLIALDDPGLLVLPYHRVLTGLSPSLFTQLRTRLNQLFLTQPLSLDMRSPHAMEMLVAQEGAYGPAIGLVGSAGEGPHLLTVADRSLVEHPPYSAAEAALHEVETWLLQEGLLRPVLGDGFGEYITYVHDSQQALDMVRSSEAQLAFFVKGLSSSRFEQLVGAGLRMPPKSTYFYPKLPSGIVINPLDGAL